MSSLPLIVIAGRTNVGKSTLFNRLTETEGAITSPLPGTTRDFRKELVSWRDRIFYLCDMAGLDQQPRSSLDETIQRHSQATLHRADGILFVVDGQEGFTSADQQLLHACRKLRTRPALFLVINKMDNPRSRRSLSPDFLQTGIKHQLQVSATNGSGTGDLLDVVVEHLPPPSKIAIPTPTMRIALIGRPNVGKSSLINAMAAEPHVLVHDQPHTTRDAIEVPIHFQGQWMGIIDTAGIRRPSRVGTSKHGPKKNRQAFSQIEKAAIAQSLRAAHRADVLALVLDLSDPLTHQDLRLFSTVLGLRKPALFVLNKWDLFAPELKKRSEGSAQLNRRIQHNLENKLGPLSFIPQLMVSAQTRHHVTDILKLSQKFYHNLTTIEDDALSIALEDFRRFLLRLHPDFASQLLSLKKTKTRPLTFQLTQKRGKKLPLPLLHVLERTLRKHLPLEGIPMLIIT